MPVSGPACTMPNGTAAAGVTWPSPDVPTNGSARPTANAPKNMVVAMLIVNIIFYSARPVNSPDWGNLPAPYFQIKI